ncbi:FkbM family methyltransferase [Rhodobium gokarnense]|uniref:FkbM family methyltransferase n=1 Tax=Rhodobium gokarnense TaxID=364296 RepID=A0ABT3HGL4_9HYPH|nr:FkbM family methyltransferase [Rhodobium gokarnense]MCW2309537.1 FkbM family methyltransferase [Rhodobium gokarnense]
MSGTALAMAETSGPASAGALPVVMPGHADAPFGSLRPGLFARALWALAMRRGLRKGLKKPLRKLAARAFPGPFDVTAGGLCWRLWPAENYCDRVILARRRLPEVEEREALFEGLRAGDTFVDIGANIGTYALDAARRLKPGGRVLAVEPGPRTHAKLAANVAANRARIGDVILRQVAVAQEAGTVTLYANAGSNAGQSSLLAEGAGRSGVAVTVEAVPLADLLAGEGIAAIAAMKIDVEGFEDRIVDAVLALPQETWPRRLQVEIEHRALWRRDAVARLREAGFATVLETTENVVLQRRA